jgi:hypothetical protein
MDAVGCAITLEEYVRVADGYLPLSYLFASKYSK